jgi:uncharacterized protein
VEFEWDPRKAAANLRKHGVSFEEAATVFGDRLAATIANPDHSNDEDRYVTVGETRSGRLVVVVHLDRGVRMRLISARPATTRERKQYEDRS